MRKFFGFVMVAVTAAGMMGCGGSAGKHGVADSAKVAGEAGGGKVLVAYYSATGTTAKAAKEIAEATGGELYEITPVKPYSAEDLDYENKESRSAIENEHPEMRPEIKTGLDVAPFETVYVGFPVWWDKAPLVINTFLDSYDFSGKKIVVFGTAHSSGLTPSFDALKAAYPNLDLVQGEILNVTSGDQFSAWVKSLK